MLLFLSWVRNLMGGTSSAVQWLRFCASTAGGMGSIPGQRTRIPHATQHGPKKRKVCVGEPDGKYIFIMTSLIKCVVKYHL